MRATSIISTRSSDACSKARRHPPPPRIWCHVDAKISVANVVTRGHVGAGDDVLAKLETVETKKEGIFVMPKDRIEIKSGTVVHHRTEL